MANMTRTRESVVSIKNPKRRLISIELKDSGSAVKQAQENLAAAQAAYDLALQRFKTAHEYLTADVSRIDPDGTEHTITEWMLNYFDLRHNAFTALTLGEAIEAALKYNTFEQESLSKSELIDELNEGGFPFKDAPRREVNAAMLKLKTVEFKDGRFRLVEEIDEL